jgi:hypothetical protein
VPNFAGKCTEKALLPRKITENQWVTKVPSFRAEQEKALRHSNLPALSDIHSQSYPQFLWIA